MIRDEPTDYPCPVCGKPLVKKTGRYGVFFGCSGYPECKTILKADKQGNPLPPAPPPTPTGIRCHKCKEGLLVVRQSKRGPFLGCSRFPRCRTIVSVKLLDKLKDLQEKGQWPPATQTQADEILGRKTASGRSKKKKSAG